MKRIWVHTYTTGSATNPRTIEKVRHDYDEAHEQHRLLGGTLEMFFSGYSRERDDMVDSIKWFREQYECKFDPEPLVQVLGRGIRKIPDMQGQVELSVPSGLSGFGGRCIFIDINDGEKK